MRHKTLELLKILEPEYRVLPSLEFGRPSSYNSSIREIRIVPTQNSTIIELENFCKSKTLCITSIEKNSKCSSKFSSCIVQYQTDLFELVLCYGANKGETFEKRTISELKTYIETGCDLGKYSELFTQLETCNPTFSKTNIQTITPRVGSTYKQNVELSTLSSVISDFYLLDSETKWGVSLKDKNGQTISALPHASTLFVDGTFNPTSKLLPFLYTFGVDPYMVQKGFNERNKTESLIHVDKPSVLLSISDIFMRVWGYNYFYVMNKTVGWKTMWICLDQLKELTNNISVSQVTYPNENSKQISIYCDNGSYFYKIDIRNSKGGEYPNDIKVKLLEK